MPNFNVQFKEISNIVTVIHVMQGTGKFVIDLIFTEFLRQLYQLFTVSQQEKDIDCLIILIGKYVKIMLRYFDFKN